MNAAFSSLRELFERATELHGAERAEFLAAHCADPRQREDLERLLAADEQAGDGVLERDPVALAQDIGAEAPGLRPGQRIGPWKLLALLGEGGSSSVFRASREMEGVTQEVALKLLRRGVYSPEAQRQFRRERQALAQLRHSGIARLIEGGLTESGLAYIALELIEGQPVTEFVCAQQQDLRARLQLFLDVCRAVEAAHRALIVHRDIKPSNVFVTREQQVKLLDFGIAKLLDAEDETQTRLASFTPAYAAPEQRRGGAITTATDVFALGVLLGELVTGERMSDGSGRSPSSRVTGDSDPALLPAPAKSLRRALRGDLDNIVMKAIEQDPERRYASATALADDIEAFLDGRPVAAHPPSRWYRAQKFVQRHRLGVIATTAFVLAILAALGVTLWQVDVARREAERADAMRDFMFSAFAEAEPSVPREGPPRVTDVVEQAITKARADGHMHREVRSELLSQLGGVLRAQGQLAQAKQTLAWVHDQAQRDFGENAAPTQRASLELARTLTLTGDFGQARHLLDRLLGSVGTDTELAAETYEESAYLATKQHELQRAKGDAGIGLRIARGLRDEHLLAKTLDHYGNVQLAVDDAQGAIATYSEQLELNRRLFGPQHADVATVQAALSRAYRRAGRMGDAEREIRAALAIDDAVLPKDHWRRARHLNALLMVALQLRDYDTALQAGEESLRINRIASGDDHPETANDLNNVGMLHARLGDHAAALPFLRESLQRVEAKFGARHFETATTRANYGVALAHAGQRAQGESELREALDALEGASEPDLDAIAATCEKLIRVELDFGAVAAAQPVLERLEASIGKMQPPDHSWMTRLAILRATLLLQSGQALPAQHVLNDINAAVANADAELAVELPLLQASAAARLGDADAADLSQTGRAALATLRHPPARLIALAQSLPH